MCIMEFRLKMTLETNKPVEKDLMSIKGMARSTDESMIMLMTGEGLSMIPLDH